MGSRSESARALPWERAIPFLLPLPRWSAAPIVSVALIVGVFLFREFFSLPLWNPEGILTFGTRVSIALVLLIGILLFASHYIAMAEFSDRQGLGLEDSTIDLEQDKSRALLVSRSTLVRSRWTGFIGLIVGVGVVQGFAFVRSDPPAAPWTGIGDHTYSILLNPIFFWLVGRGCFFAVEDARRFRRLADQGPPVDLLNLDTESAFARIGLRRALVWILVLSAGTLMFGMDPSMTLFAMTPMIPVGLVALLIASSSTFLPLRVGHDRIRVAKRREIELINAAIAGDRDAIRSSRIADHCADANLADLIAYRSLLASVPEWPLDGTALSRLVLYLLIPIASWVGGGIVEQLLSTLLDR